VTEDVLLEREVLAGVGGVEVVDEKHGRRKGGEGEKDGYVKIITVRKEDRSRRG
jgi:hypothetical protein